MTIEDTTLAFYDQKDYNDFGYPEHGIQPLDYYGEKIHYGKVDRFQNAVYLDNSNFLSQLEPGAAPMALDFVADAFDEFRHHFNKAFAFGKIWQVGIFAGGLKAESGWTSFNNLYEKHLDNLRSVFNTFLLAPYRNKKLRNYGDFLFFFREFINEYAHTMPITKEGFTKSALCPRDVSGLVIRLEGGEFGSVDKRNEWIEDANFNFYRNAATKYGFYVDESAPWCLIANVVSYEMQNYWYEKIGDTNISKHGVIFKPGDASNLFEVYYKKPHLESLDLLKKTMRSIYNEFVGEYPLVKIYKDYDPTVTLGNVAKCPDMVKTFERYRVPEQLYMDYEYSELLSIYFSCRLKEEEIEMSKSREIKILRRAKFLQKKVDKQRALVYINNMIKKHASRRQTPAYCQNYEICDFKKAEEILYDGYVPSPF